MPYAACTLQCVHRPLYEPIDALQGMLVANKRSLLERPGLLTIVHELIERFDGHLKADQFYSVRRGFKPTRATLF